MSWTESHTGHVWAGVGSAGDPWRPGRDIENGEDRPVPGGGASPNPWDETSMWHRQPYWSITADFGGCAIELTWDNEKTEFVGVVLHPSDGRAWWTSPVLWDVVEAVYGSFFADLGVLWNSNGQGWFLDMNVSFQRPDPSVWPELWRAFYSALGKPGHELPEIAGVGSPLGPWYVVAPVP